jgi:hypothetical protein
VYCNKVHVDPALSTAMFPMFSLSNGSLPDLSIGGQYGVLAPASAAGVELVTQAAWRDSKSRETMLSAAARVVVPSKPIRFDNKMLYHYVPTSATGIGPYAGSTYNAMPRYVR